MHIWFASFGRPALLRSACVAEQELLGSDTNFAAVHHTAALRASRRLGEFGL